MKTRTLTLIPVALLVVGLGACGSEDDKVARDSAGSRSSTSAGQSTGQSTGAGGPFDETVLARDLGCGFGFAKADEAGTVLLSVRHDSTSGKARRTITFPDPAWTAEVRVGRDLDANWCTDVIEEPQAVVDETWTVVAGTLTFEGDEVPPVDWSADLDLDQPVVARLTGVVLENADGERAELGNLPVRNTAWGLIPG